MTMNQRKNGLLPSPAASPRHSQQAFRPPTPASIQPKMTTSPQMKKAPVAPPVYRPQPVPKVLQTKMASAQPAPVGQTPRRPVAPPVFRPEAKKTAQPKMAAARQGHKSPQAPPVYRPQPAPSVLQTMRDKSGLSTRHTAGRTQAADAEQAGRKSAGQTSIVQRAVSRPSIVKAPIRPARTGSVVQAYLEVKWKGKMVKVESKYIDSLYARVASRLEGNAILQGYEVGNFEGGQLKALHLNWISRTKKPKIKEVLKDWIEAPKADMKNATGKTAVSRSYESLEELALAVLGEVNARPWKQKDQTTLTIEHNLAVQTLKSDHVRAQLIKFIGENLSLVSKQVGKEEGLYLPFVEKVPLQVVLQNPAKFSTPILISAIHDVADVLYGNDKANKKGQGPMAKELTVPEEKNLGTIFDQATRLVPKGIDQYDMQVLTVMKRVPVDRSWRGKQATPRESNPHIRSSRALGMPSDMGPSMTCGRLMMLADYCKADTAMKEAIAWALFAFWNQVYRRDLTDVHRFHFTMDMAANFGVKYNPIEKPKVPGS